MKCPFGRQPLYLSPWGDLFQFSKVFLHAFLKENQATSSGCKRWWCLDISRQKRCCFESMLWLYTASLRCEERLSPIKTFLLSRRHKFGSIILKNQSECGFIKATTLGLVVSGTRRTIGHKDAQICKQHTVAKHRQHYQ